MVHFLFSLTCVGVDPVVGFHDNKALVMGVHRGA